MTVPVETRALRDQLVKVRETRRFHYTEFEVREKANGSGGTVLEFEGYASSIESPYEMHDCCGPYTEVVRSGAFDKTLSEGCDTSFLLNHTGLTMARTKAGTLKLAADDFGLHALANFDAARPDVQMLRSAVERKEIDEMSMAFRTLRQLWSPDYDQRDLLELSLDKGDVSAVNYGANPNTPIDHMRSSILADLATMDPERLLVEARSAAGGDLASLVAARDRLDAAIRSLRPEQPAAPGRELVSALYL